MKSCDLSGFSCWRRWDDEAAGHAPGLPSVYAFRFAGNAFGRLKGESDLVYIGSAECLRRRLSGHLPARAEAPDCADRLRDAARFGEQVAQSLCFSNSAAFDVRYFVCR
jgi:hypothetical protein